MPKIRSTEGVSAGTSLAPACCVSFLFTPPAMRAYMLVVCVSEAPPPAPLYLYLHRDTLATGDEGSYGFRSEWRATLPYSRGIFFTYTNGGQASTESDASCTAKSRTARG